VGLYTAGIDIGSLSAKAVILHDREIIAWKIEMAGPDPAESAHRIFDSVLADCGISLSSLKCIIATGYGRINVPFASGSRTEIFCHAKGAKQLYPTARCILDVGGQDCKAIRCDERGQVTNFAMNEKCAAGTGRYLDRVASTLQIPVEEIGPRSLQIIDKPVPISNNCTVFAQIDIIRQVRRGLHLNDILAGACDAISSRIIELVDRVGVDEDFVMTGGVAKNVGVVKYLEKKLRVKANIPDEPQIVGALGAAIFAFERSSTTGN
jgi:benzoyl-CoA reductase subunit A